MGNILATHRNIVRVITLALVAVVVASSAVWLQPSVDKAEAHGRPYQRVCRLNSGTKLYYLSNHQANHLGRVVAGVDGARAVTRAVRVRGWLRAGFNIPWWFGFTNITSYNIWNANRQSGWDGVKIGVRTWGPVTWAMLVGTRQRLLVVTWLLQHSEPGGELGEGMACGPS